MLPARGGGATVGTHNIKAGITINEAFREMVRIARPGQINGVVLTHPTEAVMVTYIGRHVIYRDIFWNFKEQMLKIRIEPGDIVVFEPGL